MDAMIPVRSLVYILVASGLFLVGVTLVYAVVCDLLDRYLR